ncbi:MerR family transcriptional regulator [Sorangium sp. So ce1128]
MKIGEAAARAGLSPKTIRYYESIGLVGEPARGASSYRDYGEADVERLMFLRRARTLGFSVEQCRELLALHGNSGRASADVRAVAQRHLREMAVRIRELEGLKAVLETLVDQCEGNERPHCPILETLARPEGEPGALPAQGQGGSAGRPNDIVERYLAAFYRGDAAAARQLLADDLSYTAPGVKHDGADAFMKAAAHVAPGTRGYEIHKIFVDGSDVGVFYDLLVKHRVGRFPLAEWHRVRAGRIASIRVLFDTAPFMHRPATKPENTAVDPVCKMPVDKASPPVTRSHQGTTYYFCNPGCAVAFAKHPEEYLSA